MLRTRCPYCGRPFSISREEAGAILAQAMAENARYGTRECPFCRRLVKIGLAELRRAAPAPAGAPVPAAVAPEVPAPSAASEEAPGSAVAVQEVTGLTGLAEPPASAVEAASLSEAPAEPSPRRRGKRAKAAEASEEAAPKRPRTASSKKGETKRTRRSSKQEESE